MSIFPFISQQTATSLKAEQIRIQGTAQGIHWGRVVYRLAKQYGLRGQVRPSSSGTEIVVVGPEPAIERLVAALRSHLPQRPAPPTLTRTPYGGSQTFVDFDLIGQPHSWPPVMVPDLAICPVCQPGPRPGPAPRRHVQGNAVACPHCGLQVWLEHPRNAPSTPADPLADPLDQVRALLRQGKVVAIQGLAGLQLVCDATHEGAVRQLRRPGSGRPLALMAEDLSTIEHYCRVGPEEKVLLESAAAPTVLLTLKQEPLPGFWLEDEFLSFHRGDLADQIPIAWETTSSGQLRSGVTAEPDPSDDPEASPPLALKPIAPSVALGQQRLGFMLPHTALHHLILQGLERPLALTSDGLAELPCNPTAVQAQQLAAFADAVLLNDLEIANPVPDSVVQVCQGQQQVLQRGRGYASRPIWLPEGFEQAPPLLSLGSDRNSTLCRIQAGQALISQPLGDIHQRQAYETYRQTLQLFSQQFAEPIETVAVDQQPSSRSTQLGLSLSQQFSESLCGNPRVQAIQHHHAHIAACMAENGLPIKTPPILGIALDGLGAGDDGTLWGGEFLLADYRGYRRLGALKPVDLLGGEAAIYQPWRSTYAHLRSAFDWAELLAACGDLDLIDFLANKSQTILEMTLEQGAGDSQSPLTSSAERLFDAVAAAVGLCREEATYEGQGAAALEALIEPVHLVQTVPYPFESVLRTEDGLWLIDPHSMWLSLLADLMQEIDAATIAARFHVGLAAAIAALTQTLQSEHPFTLVALSGSVFQNQVLAMEVKRRIEALGLTVLTHSKVPPNNGGLSLGQAVIAAARQLGAET